MPNVHQPEPGPPARRWTFEHDEGELPTLPIVVARLIRLYGSEDYSVNQVVQVLEADPPISSRVLRLANSAYYGFAGRVEQLHRGVVLLGGVTVQGIALGATVLRRWARSAPPEHVRKIWVHAYLCGAGCRYLGCRLPVSTDLPAPDALFMVGLFHDVGKIFFLARDGDGYAAPLENLAGEELRGAEQELFDLDHAEMGAELLEAWGLPGRIIALVRHHHGGDLRAELQPALEVLRCIDSLLAEEEVDAIASRGDLPPALCDDVRRHLEQARPGAEAFYKAVA